MPFRKALAVCLLSLAVVLGPAAAVAQETGTGGVKPFGRSGKWQLIFNDEFDGIARDLGKWHACYWWSAEGCTNQSNLDMQWYVARNVRVSDGQLTLTARPETITTPDGETFAYTSGMVASAGFPGDENQPPLFAFTYGYAEIRARLPRGKGLFPAFWMQPPGTAHYPEIDVFEAIGQEINKLNNAYHYYSRSGKKVHLGHVTKTVDLSRDWHVYAVQWRADAIIWYFDGKEVWRLKDPSIIANEPLYLLITLAVGGQWPGPPNAKTPFPAELAVDYVRVWKPAL